MIFRGSISTTCLASLLFFSISCQQEFENVDPIDEEKNLSTESPSIELLYRLTLLDGSEDNVLDGASCLTLTLPVGLSIDDISYEVNSKEDFSTVEKALNDGRLESEEIDFDYPIEVTTWDHRTITVTSEDELEDWVSECEEGEDDDIECLDIIYPISITTFNLETEQAGNFSFSSDKDFNIYLAQITEDEILSIDFPLELTSFDDLSHNPTSNSELEALILSYANTCDEADVIFSPRPDTAFINALQQVTWSIDFYYDEEDLTSEYAGLTFNFKEDLTIEAIGAATELGEWEALIDEKELVLMIEELDGETLDDLNDYWIVEAYSDDQIILTDESEEKQIILGNVNKELPNELEINMTSSEGWIIASFDNEGEDETAEYTELEFGFFSDGTLLITGSDESEYQGLWSTVGNEILVISITDDEYDDLNSPWTVISFTEEEVILKYENADSESGKQLIFNNL